jgi:hypothetical protein
MANVDKALATQMANIEKRTGKSLKQLSELVASSKLQKHGELVAMLKDKLGMGHGDANTVVHFAKGNLAGQGAASNEASSGDVLNALYSGPKAHLRPIHEKLMRAIRKFGEFEEAPKKSYVSLRRKKQFAMIGPATNTRVEVGLNMKGVEPTTQLQKMPAGQMCQYKVKLTDAGEVDDALIGWLRIAFDAAG